MTELGDLARLARLEQQIRCLSYGHKWSATFDGLNIKEKKVYANKTCVHCGHERVDVVRLTSQKRIRDFLKELSELVPLKGE